MSKIKTILIVLLLVTSKLLAQTDRDALIALYNATDGPNWTDNTNWDTAAPLNTWFGVTTDALGNVISLDLSNPGFAGNNLNGTLPDELGDLPFLTFLVITDNLDLTGPIPATLENLSNLEFLSFRRNALNGPIPPSMGNLINLTTLRLTLNNLTGPIPDTFGNLLNLQNIELNSNQLSGPIPDEIGNLTNLLTLDLNTNDLTGPIPASLANLVNLERLRLYTNQLNGEIPTFLGSLTELRELSISNNQFTGEIPPELGSLTNLVELVVGINNLSGTLPATLGNLANLEILDVSAANLSGNLPSTLSLLTNLIDLRLGINTFEGPVPPIIFDTSGVPPYFDMRFNQFHFGDFEDEFGLYSTPPLTFLYDQQANVDEAETIGACTGQTITLTTTVRGNSNVYQWFQDGVPIPNSDTPNLELTNVQNGTAGVYTCQVTSTIVTGLVLERNPITLTVGAGGIPVANPVEDLYACDFDGDGFAEFEIDLTAIDRQVLGNQTGLPVSYFDADGNPLTLPNPFTNSTEGTQTITVRVGDETTCFDETTFQLITLPTTPADVVSDIGACEYELPDLNPGNSYYSASGGQGEPIPPGTLITSTQTIYIYTETVQGEIICSDESSFTVTVDPISCQDEELTTLPTFFTPNNDGTNDLWDISALAGTGIKITIYNRYGQLLEQLDPDTSQGWSGRYRGTELPSSDYWYRYTDPETGRDIKGHFTLKR